MSRFRLLLIRLGMALLTGIVLAYLLCVLLMRAWSAKREADRPKIPEEWP